MTPSNGQPPAIINYFVDEAGDSALFDRKGRLIVGNAGCSKFFILGKLEVNEPQALTATMEKLRGELLADVYFKGLPSMQPKAKKTAVMFHAKDDVPEVRREVLKLLLGQKVRFYAAVRDKQVAASYEKRLREKDPKYRYRPNDMYDGLVGRLFWPRPHWHQADQVHICFSRRGKSDRTAALSKAIAQTIAAYEWSSGIVSHSAVQITHSSPPGSGALQAVDYFLWALQRFYEFEHTEKRESECRYVEMIHELTGEIDDMDFVLEGECGTSWNKHHPLSLAARAIDKGAKNKPGI